MIPIEKLRSLERAYVHANCPDGVASALILKDALPDLDVRFVKYGTAEHREIEPAPNTIFCDFSPWLPKLEDPRGTITCEDGRVAHITDKGVLAVRDDLIKAWNDAGVIVLDHHSKDIVDPYTFGVFGENEKLECGAMLAYREVWVPLCGEMREHFIKKGFTGPSTDGIEHFARLAAIRDTWQKDHPDFELACRQAAVLMFFRLEQLSFDLVEEMQITLAPRLFERQIELAETCIKEALHFMSEQGTRVLMFQGVSATSDAAELLTEMADEMGATDEPSLIVGFHYRTDAGKLQLQFSTRSHTGFDCRAFAQAHGGNGHPEAAGFTLTTGQKYGSPYDVFQDLLNDYEAKL